MSVEKSEYLSRQLQGRGIPHEVLNAKQHTREAAIVAQAGRLHAITVATNMAGRGVDIILGGNPEGLARHEVLKEGHEPDVMVDHFALPLPLEQMPEDFREARAKAMARYDELLAEYRQHCAEEGDQVRQLGGLYVIGSERHESRRIDNQLRGRSGRQGDPGESRFYLSLDDELMRLFATGALSYVMNKALPDDEAIEAKMVTKAIERAQTTVETRNAEIRKNVLKYDEVMNEQRKVIYQRRDQILEGVDLKSAAMEYLDEAVEALIETHCASPADDEWDLDGLAKELKTFWPTSVTEQRLGESRDTDDMRDLVMVDAHEHYERRETELGDEVMREVERQVMLRIIDQRWREHLEEMDYLKEGINLRAMGQKDPLTEWQREGYEMFGAMMKGIAQDFVRYVMHVQVVRNDEQPATTVQNVQEVSSDTRAVVRLRPGRRRCLRDGEIEEPAEPSPTAITAGRATRARGAGGEAGDGRQGRVGQDPAQRSVPVWVGQEVQDVPRRRLTAPALLMRDFTDDLRELRRRLGEAEVYLRVGEARGRLDELETDMSRPDLWDDPDEGEGDRRRVCQPARRRDDVRRAGVDARRRRRAPRPGAGGGRRVTGARDRVDRRRPRPPARPARAAQSVQWRARRRRLRSCRSTPRTAASTPRTSARCCCACTGGGPSVEGSR